MLLSILSIGDELLKGTIANTNAATIGKELIRHGVQPDRQLAVPDTAADIKDGLDTLLRRADIVVCTGGLGPTTDDLTVETVAAHFGLELRVDQDVKRHVATSWGRLGLPGTPPENLYKQAVVPCGAEIFPNRNGTAPGVCVRSGGKIVYLLPGPPFEMGPMFKEDMLPQILAANPDKERFEVIQTYGVPESRLQDLTQTTLGAAAAKLNVAYRAEPGACELTLSGKDAALVEEMAAVMRRELGDRALPSGMRNVVEEMSEVFKRCGLTMATAESCTGGMVAVAITDYPGVSAFFKGSVVAYSNELKQALLGVRPETLEQHGAVSEECAKEMVEGLCARLGVDAGVSITGIAGPDGGTAEKPVGLVYVAAKLGDQLSVKRHTSRGSREAIRRRALFLALNQLRELYLPLR